MNKTDLCPIVRDLMPLYIDDLTEPDTRIFIDRHLAECKSCRNVRRNMLNIAQPEEHAQSEFLSILRNSRLRRRRRNVIILVTLLVIAAICLLPLPRRVHTTVQAFRWRAGAPGEETRSVQIVMYGTYLDFLLFDDRFLGDIVIEDNEFTQTPGSLLSVRIDPSYPVGHLIYKQSDGSLRTIGFIVSSPGMKEFVIGLHEDDRWEGSDGLVLTYPASNREDAVNATRIILTEQNCTWLSESNWEGGSW